MKKRFEIGTAMESNTEYIAEEKIYHVYQKDTVRLSDDRYIPQRGKSEPEFDAFLVIKDQKNITLDFGGATIVLHGKIQPFLLDHAENITIKNCKVTYDRPPFTEFTILETGADFVKLKANEGCTYRIEDRKLIPCSETWENTELNCAGHFHQVFDAETGKGCGLHLGKIGEPYVEDPRPFPVDSYKVRQEGEYVILTGRIPDFYQPGRKLVVTHEPRNLSSVFMIDSKNVSVENYRVLCGFGMGIYAHRTENIALDHVIFDNVNGSPFIVSNAADAVHTFGTSGKFEIKNSVFRGMIDDAINIHSNFRTVDHVCGNVLYSNLASCEVQVRNLYKPGDTIAVYKGATLEKAAEYVIEKVENVDKNMRKFTLDRPCQEHQSGDLIENMSCNCDVTIENCIMGNANSHLRFQSRGKFVMSNCEDELEILLSGDASYWFESGPITDLTIENCKFKTDHAKISITSEVMPTEKEPYYHKNIKVLNNEFDSETPITGGYADGIVFLGNKNAFGKKMKLELVNCGSVEADNCEIERKTEVKTELKVN